jgi:threonine/homoserine/homoserine lactone efflux protein
VWALLAAAGFAALVAASEVAYLVLRVAGAAFLIFLGVRAWRAAWQQRRGAAEVPEPAPISGTRGWAAFGEGFVVMLANPKAAVFMIAFYPQFVPADMPLFATTAALAALQVVLETGFYLALAAGVARAGGWFRRPRIRARLEAVSGTVLVGLGLRVAVTAR